MPGQGRLGDKANVSADAHGCPGCPHPGTGPAIMGSPDVFVNGRPALRVDDIGIHAACCGPNMWRAQKGAPTVFINGKASFRQNDASKHCGGQGQLIEGSADVIVGDASSGGGGGGGGGGGASGGSSGGGSLGGGGSASPGAGSSSGGAGAASPSGASGASSSPDPGAGGSADPAAGDPPAEHDIDEDQIEILVLNVNGDPQGDIEFALTLPDGTTKTGRTAGDGFIRFSHLTQRGECTLDFPDLEQPAPVQDG